MCVRGFQDLLKVRQIQETPSVKSWWLVSLRIVIVINVCSNNKADHQTDHSGDLPCCYFFSQSYCQKQGTDQLKIFSIPWCVHIPVDHLLQLPCPPACNIMRATEQIFMTFVIGEFFKQIFIYFRNLQNILFSVVGLNFRLTTLCGSVAALCAHQCSHFCSVHACVCTAAMCMHIYICTPCGCFHIVASVLQFSTSHMQDYSAQGKYCLYGALY